VAHALSGIQDRLCSYPQNIVIFANVCSVASLTRFCTWTRYLNSFFWMMSSTLNDVHYFSEVRDKSLSKFNDGASWSRRDISGQIM